MNQLDYIRIIATSHRNYADQFEDEKSKARSSAFGEIVALINYVEDVLPMPVPPPIITFTSPGGSGGVSTTPAGSIDGVINVQS